MVNKNGSGYVLADEEIISLDNINSNGKLFS